MASLSFHLFRVGSKMLSVLPQWLVSGGVRIAAGVAYRFARKKRALVSQNMQRACPQTSAKDIRRQSKQAFVSYARYYADTARLARIAPDKLDRGFGFCGWEHIERSRAESGSAILALPHLGGWEWAGMWVAQVPKVPVSVVVEELGNQRLFEWMRDYRSKLNMHVIPLDKNAGKAASKALSLGHILCLLCDRDIQGNGKEVEFFSELTTLPYGAATLALRSGAHIMPTAVYYRGNHRFGVVMPPVDATRAGRLKEDAARMTQDITHSLERLIRVAPEQWHLMQPNWPSDPGFKSQEHSAKAA